MHPTLVIKLVQECGWHITLHAQPNTSTGGQRGDLLDSMARQWLDWSPLLYFTMQYAPTRQFVLGYANAPTQRQHPLCKQKPSPFALSVNFTSWVEWTEGLTASSVYTQDTSHSLGYKCTPTHIHRPHVGLRLEFTSSHSVEMATLFSKAHSDGPALFPLKIPDLQEAEATSGCRTPPPPAAQA